MDTVKLAETLDEQPLSVVFPVLVYATPREKVMVLYTVLERCKAHSALLERVWDLATDITITAGIGEPALQPKTLAWYYKGLKG